MSCRHWASTAAATAITWIPMFLQDPQFVPVPLYWRENSLSAGQALRRCFLEGRAHIRWYFLPGLPGYNNSPQHQPPT